MGKSWCKAQELKQNEERTHACSDTNEELELIRLKKAIVVCGIWGGYSSLSLG